MSTTLLIAAAILTATAAIIAVIFARSERRARFSSRRSRAELGALMDATGFGVLIVEADGRISAANSAAVDTLGYPESHLLGREKHTVIHANMLNEDGVCPLRNAIATRQRYIGQDHFVDIRGNLVPVSVSCAPLDDIGGAVILFRDRSTEVAQERQREQAFALISHELRSPLTTVVGFSQRLQRAVATGRLQVGEQHAEEINLLAQEAGRMRDIVTVVLEAATVDRPIEVESEPIVIARLVSEETQRVQRQNPSATFAIEADEDAIIESDERYVRRVVQNLLENAVKYGGTEQPIQVDVCEDAGGIAVRVRDHGPGIPREAQSRIFDRFYRQETVAGRRPGLGLGLFLARRLTHRLGGRLTVASEVGQGSTFTFWLPAEVPEAVPVQQETSPNPITW